MDDFSVQLAKNTMLSLTESDQTFQGSRENIYQRKLNAVQESLAGLVFSILVCTFSLNTFFHWGELNALKIAEICLCLAGIIIVVVTNNFLSFKPTKGKPSKPSSRTASGSSVMEKLPSLQLTLLIVLQELMILIYKSTSSGVMQWVSRLLIAFVVHVAYMDKYNKAKSSVTVRAGLQFLISLVEFKNETLLANLFALIGVGLSYICLINGLKKVNKFLRTEFIQRDVQTKFLNQFYLTLDALPFPIIVFDPSRADSDKSMKIVYFNFSGDEMIAAKEKSIENNDLNREVNFLDLIDPQDEATLLDALDLIKQNKSPYETMPTEIVREAGKGKVRFDITLWKMRWMEKDVIVALFNNDNYKEKKQTSRFNYKYIEGLENIIDKNTEIIDTAIANLKLFKEGKMQDPKALYDQMSLSVADLSIRKQYIENIFLGEPWNKADELKTFNAKLLILNVVDNLSREIKTKDIALRVEFNRGFPQNLIETKVVLLKAFFFNLLYYIENKLNTGTIIIQCDGQDREEEDEDKTSYNLNFFFKVESVREKDLPPRNFLNSGAGTTMTLPQLKPSSGHPNESRMIGWLSYIKEELDIKVKTYPTQSNENGDRQ